MMFELKYKITDDDLSKINMRVMWTYFIPYAIVALFGIGAGIAATVLKPTTPVFVLGIILIVLGAVLLACSVMLLIAPKNFVASILITSDTIERTVKFSDSGITVQTEGQSDISIGYNEIVKVKRSASKRQLLLYVGKEQILLVKDAFINGDLEDLAAFLSARSVGSADRKNAEVKPSGETVSGETVSGDVPDEVNNTVDAAADSSDGQEQNSDARLGADE